MNTKELFGKKNPWVDVAAMYTPNNPECLYGDNNNYVCSGDKVAIDNYNEKAKGSSDEIKTQIPAEPWWGNPLKARLIILSLNPGYVPEVNMTLAKLMQANEAVRRQLIDYKAKTLRLEADSFLPLKDDDLVGSPVSCRDAVNMLGDWYWVKMLKHLREDVEQRNSQIREEEFYKQVALIEYCGYSSETAKRELPKSENGSNVFLKELIRYISKKEDVLFLIMRDVSRWEKLLKSINCHEDKWISRKPGSRSQYVTPENLVDGESENGNYNKLLSFLAK